MRHPVAVAPDWIAWDVAERTRLDEEDQRIEVNLVAGGLDRRAMPTTPRETAEHLIMVYVARGDDVGWLARGGMGRYSTDWRAHIGGWTSYADGRRKQFDCWHLIVERVNGQDLAEPAVFGLRAVYDDLHRRMHEGRQLPLFVEVMA